MSTNTTYSRQPYIGDRRRTEQTHRPSGLIRLLGAALLTLATFLAAPTEPTDAAVRLKDIINIEGVRDNMLVGYGLVVGLNGTGDSLSNAPFTEQSLIGMLERLGINTRDASANLKTKNVAAVMVTATLPPFSSQGSRIDVTVSTLGDCTNLLGGTLLVTPLLGADGQVYAVSQGSVSTSGFSASGTSGSVTKGVPTAGRIANGAIIEREINFSLADLSTIHLSLKNPDFTTAERVAKAINVAMNGSLASVPDPASVVVNVPADRHGDVVGLITQIEQLQVTPDLPARVVIDEHSGVIVMGENVRISTVAIAQGNLTIRITEAPQVSQPNALSTTGTTEVVNRTDIKVDQGEGQKMAVLSQGVSLQELVQSLNALGISPRDMISILQSVKAAGALQADIEVM